jgi:hypothetical protein
MHAAERLLNEEARTMKDLRNGAALLTIAVGVLVSVQWTLHAQERRNGPDLQPPVQSRAREPGGGDMISVQDALQRPFAFPFAAPTSLSDVCQYLRRTLRAPVVLDRAALDRQELEPDDQVQLELEGVRLKTGLKLLLDQVGLTFQVVPEDNLLILTDTQGSAEPIDRVLSEVKALHRDVHDLQDAVDDLRAALAPGQEGGPKVHKPTIIEELPGENKPAEKPQPLGRSDRPRSRPGA